MAIPDVRYTPKNTPITFNVRQNDIGNLLVKSWVTPSNLKGTLSNTNGSGSVTFTPTPGYTGVTTFYYKIGNMFVPDLEMAAVQMIVGDLAPSTPTFQLTTAEETPLVINYKIPFNGFNFSVTDQPEHGSISFFPGFSTQTINGQTFSGHNLLIYTPDANFTGQDEFEINYCVNSNNDCYLTKIAVDIVPVFSAPGPYCVSDCVWTGDVNADGIVNNKDVLPLGYAMGLAGPTRNYAALEWYGQHSGSWNNPFLDVSADLKHADTDGSGRVDSQDTLAISLFYGLTHQLTPRIPPSSKGLPFFFNLLTPDPGVGDLVEIEISLGNASQPVTNLYGFTFDATLSPQILDSALQIQYFDGSWLNANAADIWMSKNPAPGRLESVFTRTNGVSANGEGLVGVMSFIIIDIVDDSRPESRQPYFTVEFDAPTLLWADGSLTEGERLQLDIPLRMPGQAASASAQDLRVYPSPARDWVQVHLNGEEAMVRLRVFDLNGTLLYDSGAIQQESARIPVRHLPPGAYIAAAQTSSGQVVKKFQVQGF
ncbi:MAG: T9SS type A sorting domain-containing protein [Saprospiraceae bacterium]|nr:T9SS type A sorting domain-containing protein [Saprospiraceae bacterium]